MYARSGQINTMNELAVIMRSLGNMAIPVVEFSRKEYTIKKVFGYCSQMKLMNFANFFDSSPNTPILKIQ